MADFVAAASDVPGVAVLMERLAEGERPLLAGPDTEIAAMAHALSAEPPANDKQLRQRLLDLIEGTAGCSFAPFIELDWAAAVELAATKRDMDRRVRESEARFAQRRLL